MSNSSNSTALRSLALGALLILVRVPLTILGTILLTLRPLAMGGLGLGMIGGVVVASVFAYTNHLGDAVQAILIAGACGLGAVLYATLLQLCSPGWERFAAHVEYRELN